VHIVTGLNGPHPTIIDTTCRFEVKQRALDSLDWHCFKGDAMGLERWRGDFQNAMTSIDELGVSGGLAFVPVRHLAQGPPRPGVSFGAPHS